MKELEFRLERVDLPEEELLCYSHTDEPEALGCIGHLRGDFGVTGKEDRRLIPDPADAGSSRKGLFKNSMFLNSPVKSGSGTRDFARSFSFLPYLSITFYFFYGKTAASFCRREKVVGCLKSQRLFKHPRFFFR